ncbi:hypothetical protein DdX_12915 [Ditylenchus destructor]|uniref:Uncharacterized protein n=1 Tax=Ditylenchus destructor TaxID=166010 RepID=A0AAD4MWC1_9BILA|nr:hypothetical protein DdX_12915 [Ditylenchus destructor]
MEYFEFSSVEIKTVIGTVLEESGLSSAKADPLGQYLQQLISNGSECEPKTLLCSDVDTNCLSSSLLSIRNVLVTHLRKRLHSFGILEEEFKQGVIIQNM